MELKGHMPYIARYLESDIKARLFAGKAIIVYGPRQCGKTTMLRHITEEWSNDVLWLNGDSPDTRDELERVTVARWKLILGKKKFLCSMKLSGFQMSDSH